jgi:RHS repeat-associated protein
MTGNLTNYIYSTENQLVRVEMYESSFMFKEVDYIYDALGRRIEKKVQDHTAPNDKMKSFTRRYAYDGTEIIVEFNESNEPLTYYTHSSLRLDDVLSVDVTAKGVTEKIAQVQGSYHYLKDALGSITSVSSSSGNVIQGYHYTSYGKLTKVSDYMGSDVTASPILSTPFTFTGREKDTETGMYYLRARYYDPENGRFISGDLISGGTGVPRTQNKYIFGINNPLSFGDPTGLFADPFTAMLFIQEVFTAAVNVTAFFGNGPSQKFAQMILVAGAAALVGATVGALFEAKWVAGLAGGGAGGVTGGVGFEALDLGTFKQGFAFGFSIGFKAGYAAGGVKSKFMRLVDKTLYFRANDPYFCNLFLLLQVRTILSKAVTDDAPKDSDWRVDIEGTSPSTGQPVYGDDCIINSCGGYMYEGEASCKSISGGLDYV